MKLSPRASVLLLLALLASGCAQWRVESVAPEQVFAAPVDKAMIVLVDSTTLILHRPVLRDGVVVGTRESIRGRVHPRDTVAIPLSAIAETRTWYPGWVPLGPMAVILGLAGLLFVAARPST